MRSASLSRLALASLIAFGASLGAAQAAPQIGAAAPEFSLTDADGNTRSLSEFRGKTVVLEWTNHECPFVKKHYNGTNMQAQQRAAAESGVVWLTLNSSAAGKQGHVDASTAKQIAGDWNAANAAYLFDADGTVGRAYAAKTTPHMYVIDGEGVLRYNGAIDSIPSADVADIADAVQYVPTGLSELSAGGSISTSVTQPYGCSIKYADS
ncbi:redoxin domain-containing protein [Aquimonas sp.]|jgi:peroxiredoxin|uniref:redoxin domain-containing protein n=1 Tax=Aquimonas sp. TaxID=1872588 RepID=UPI0037C042FD